MKRTVVALIAVAATSSLVCADPGVQSPEQQVRAAFNALTTAMARRDLTAVNRYVASDALFASGYKVASKQEAFKVFARPITKTEQSIVKNRSVLSVKVQGDNAIVIERIWRSDGKQIDTKLLTTNIFARHNDRWQLVASTTNEE
jgi:ketosteroid isomerase-like protein